MNSWFRSALLLAALTVAPATIAAAADDADSDPHWSELEYSGDGADDCLACHDETSEYPVLDIFKTRHGHPSDGSAPFGNGQLQCEACHGPGDEHGGRVRRNQPRPPIPAFGENALATTAEENGICIDCHRRLELGGWPGSEHEAGDIACGDCHRIHVVEDPMLDRRIQSEQCVTCHQTQRADLLRPSAHPLRYGEMACTDCHSPHGSMAEHGMVQNTVRDTCTSCHAEKRGPFLWDHEPVAEDCGNCHRPHGSNHPKLLKARQPLLCQQCHSRLEHPGLAFTGDQLPGSGGNLTAFTVAQGCANCHSQVHGSNHPSGANLAR